MSGRFTCRFACHEALHPIAHGAKSDERKQTTVSSFLFFHSFVLLLHSSLLLLFSSAPFLLYSLHCNGSCGVDKASTPAPPLLRFSSLLAPLSCINACLPPSFCMVRNRTMLELVPSGNFARFEPVLKTMVHIAMYELCILVRSYIVTQGTRLVLTCIILYTYRCCMLVHIG